MKKLLTLLFTAFVALTLAACGNSGGNSEDTENSSNEGATEEENKTLVVGASAVPHAEILEQAKPILKEKGITLEIEEFSKYDVINKALVEGI